MDNSNLILKLINKVAELEERIKNLEDCFSLRKNDSNAVSNLHIRNEIPLDKPQRDKTRYLFNGKLYLKNRLVLAVVSDYVKRYQFITRNELIAKFPKSLQGSLGVIELVEIAEQRKDYDIRFFAKKDEILSLSDGKICVCSQWGILNIPRFVRYANEYLGYDIKELI